MDSLHERRRSRCIPINLAVAKDRVGFVGKNAPDVYGTIGAGGKFVGGRPNGTLNMSGTQFSDGTMGGAFTMVAGDGGRFDGRFAVVGYDSLVGAGKSQFILGMGKQTSVAGGLFGPERANTGGAGGGHASTKEQDAALKKSTDPGIPKGERGPRATGT